MSPRARLAAAMAPLLLVVAGCGVGATPSAHGPVSPTPTSASPTPTSGPPLLVVADPSPYEFAGTITVRFYRLDGGEVSHVTLPAGTQVIVARGARVFVLSNGKLRGLHRDGSFEELADLGKTGGEVTPSPDGTRWLWSSDVRNASSSTTTSAIHLGGDGLKDSVITAINALAHCVKACYARDVNPVVPPVALEGIRLIARSLPRCVVAGDDIEAREDLLRGAYLAGFSIANATMALHHGLCHVLGGRTGVAHGVLNAIMLAHVMRFNASAAPEAMAAIAAAMDAGPHPALPLRGMEIPPAEAAAEATAALVASLPVPGRLRDAGVPEAVLDSVAVEAAGNSTAQANPTPVSEADVRELLRAAW